MEEILTLQQLLDLINQGDTEVVDIAMLTDLVNFIQDIAVGGGFGSMCLPMNGFIGNPFWAQLIQSSPSYITNSRVLEIGDLLSTLGYSYTFRRDPRCPSEDGVGLLQISWDDNLPRLALHRALD